MTETYEVALFFLLFVLTAVIIPTLVRNRWSCEYGGCRHCPHQRYCLLYQDGKRKGGEK